MSGQAKEERDWPSYYAKTGFRPPRATLLRESRRLFAARGYGAVSLSEIVGAQALAQAPSVERPQRGQQARVAARRPAFATAPGQVVEQAGAVRTGDIAAVAPAREALQVAAVAVQGLPRGAGLRPPGVDEGIDGARVAVAQRRQPHRARSALGGRGRGHRRQLSGAGAGAAILWR